jgi:hypothetical protein
MALWETTVTRASAVVIPLLVSPKASGSYGCDADS